ncbi:MAG: MltA domain-containing protein [Elusimicrobiota bacterium]
MKKTLFPLLALSLALAACLPPPRPGLRPAGPSVTLVPPAQWPPLRDDLDADSLARAAERTLAYLKALAPKLTEFGDRKVGPQLMRETAEELVRLRREARTPEELAAGLRERFDLYRVSGATTAAGGAFFSAYYQPVLKASPVRTERFAFPLYRKPADLLEADLGAFGSKWKGEGVVGRVEGGRFVPYFDRGDIDVRRRLEGRKLELAWLENAFDRVDLHVQGSGLLEFPDGKMVVARYAATNGLPYRSVGVAVVGSGAMRREEIDRERLRRYLAEHPEGEAWLLAQNPRYAFFELADAPADGEPFGQIGQPLTAGRSAAVDPKTVPLGLPAFIRLPMAQVDAEGRLLGKADASRFVFCQDVGSAITGPGRVDLYVGHGLSAMETAVRVWDAGELYILLKKLPARDR